MPRTKQFAVDDVLAKVVCAFRRTATTTRRSLTLSSAVRPVRRPLSYSGAYQSWRCHRGGVSYGHAALVRLAHVHG